MIMLNTKADSSSTATTLATKTAQSPLSRIRNSGEDLSQIRTGNLHRLAGATNIAKALRHHARDTKYPGTLLLTS